MATEGDSEDIFEDAAETIDDVDMSTGLEQTRLAAFLFFSNKFNEAKKLLEPWAQKSLYHALGYGTFMYLQAFLTFDPRDIEEAAAVLKQSVEVCNSKRRKNTIGESLGKIVKKADYYNAYTEEEIHAELCYAECLLLRAILSFVEDETLISFIKGSFKLRNCYISYRECWQILEQRNFSNDKHKSHFESGVCMGVGTFNLLITHLPGKILKLLEFVGFTPNRSWGLSELEQGFSLPGSLRKVMCGLTLLFYHTFAVFGLGHGEGDLQKAQSILDDLLELYPSGALFLFFRARMSLIQGDVENAAIFYENSRQSQSDWRQLHHICYWELYWCNMILGRNKEAEESVEVLRQESKWSKAMYAYAKACSLITRRDQLTSEEHQELNDIMRDIPLLKQRIAGKSIPMEKFAVKMSQRFFSQGETLTLPGAQIQYIFNFFKVLGKRYEDVERVYLCAESEIQKFQAVPSGDQNELYWDSLCLAQLIKGVSLSYMKSPLQALECFKFIIDSEKKIVSDTFLVPFAFLEVALLHLKQGDLEQTKLILNHARHNYKGFSMENRFLFRAHSALFVVKEGLKKRSEDGTLAPSPPAPSGGLKLPLKFKRSPSPIDPTANSFMHLNGGASDDATQTGTVAADAPNGTCNIYDANGCQLRKNGFEGGCSLTNGGAKDDSNLTPTRRAYSTAV